MTIFDQLISARAPIADEDVTPGALILVENGTTTSHSTISGLSKLLTVTVVPPTPETPEVPETDTALATPSLTYGGTNQFTLGGIDLDADVFEYTLDGELQTAQPVSGLTYLVIDVPAASSTTLRGRLVDYDGKDPSEYVEASGGEASTQLDPPTVSHLGGVDFLISNIDSRATQFKYELNTGLYTEDRPSDGMYSVGGVSGQTNTVRAQALGSTDGLYTSSEWVTVVANDDSFTNPGEPEDPTPTGTLATPTLEDEGSGVILLGGIDLDADQFVYTVNGGAEVSVNVAGQTTVTLALPEFQQNTLIGRVITNDSSLNPSAYVEITAGVNSQQLSIPFVEAIGNAQFIITSIAGSVATEIQYQLNGGATITSQIPPGSILVEGFQGGATEVRARVDAPNDPSYRASEWRTVTQDNDPSIPGGGNEIF